MSDSYEDAVAGVSSSGQQQSNEKAVSIRKPRNYPQAPEGVHRAICVSAEIKEVQQDSQYAQKGDKRIHFGWEIQDATYQDDEGQARKYRVWSKPMTMMFKKGKGKTPNIVMLLTKLTGFPPFVTKTKVMVDIGAGKQKEYDAEVFDQSMVMHMECNLVIAHSEWEGQMRAGIDTYTTTEEQRKGNFGLLTAEARQYYKGQPVQTEAPLPPSPSSEDQVAPGGPVQSPVPVEAPIPGDPKSTEQTAQITKEMEDRGFPV